jgi:toxin ParE1/3/4
MRAFEVRPLVPIDIEEAVAWYEQARVGLGADFADVAFAALRGIERHDEYVTAPYRRFPFGVVRRVFLVRFPYRVFFLETDEKRAVLRVLRHGRSDRHWRTQV